MKPPGCGKFALLRIFHFVARIPLLISSVHESTYIKKERRKKERRKKEIIEKERRKKEIIEKERRNHKT